MSKEWDGTRSPFDAVQVRTDRFRDCIDAIKGAIAFGQQGSNPPPEGEWLAEFWQIGRKLADQGWVPVRKRLPKVGESVLVAIEFDRPGDWRIKVGGLRNDRTWQVFGASYTPSHWMPLPAGPQPPGEGK